MVLPKSHYISATGLKRILQIFSSQSFAQAYLLFVISFGLVHCGNIKSELDDIVASTIPTESTAVTVHSVSSSTANGSYKAGDLISIDVMFSEIVTVSGAPELALAISPTVRNATYFSGSGTTVLTFHYTVLATDTSSDLDYSSATALSLGGGAINDVNGGAVTLTLPTPGFIFSLGSNNSIVIDTTAPNAPSAIAFDNPASGAASFQGNVASPRFSISGVAVNDTVKIFSDNTCTTEVGTATVSVGTTALVTTTAALADGTYTIYANATDLAGNVSTCSTSTVTYILDTVAPGQPGVAMHSPAAPAGITPTPVIRVSSIISTDKVTLYSDSSCTTAASSEATSSGTTVDITVNAVAFGSYSFYARVTDAAGNVLSCSTAHADYIYATQPTVQFSTATQNFNDVSGAMPESWSPMSAWEKRIKLKFLHSSNAETQTNIPVMVKLTSSRVTYADFKANGADIRFTDSSGNLLAYEIESWNTLGDSYIWVKVPQITGSSNSDYIHMYYKNAAAVDAQNVSGVWDSNYVGVWHLNGAVGGIANNATIPHTVGPDATALNSNGTGMAYQAAQIGQGIVVDGSDDSLSVAHQASLNLNTAWTISAWVKFAAMPSGGRAIVTDTFAGKIQYCLGTCDSGTGTLSASFYDGSWRRAPLYTLTNDMLGQWKHVTGVYNGAAGSLSLYVDGALVGTNTGIPATALTDGQAKRFGRRWDGSENLNGALDEVTFSNVPRSAGWVKTQYMSSSDTLINYGPEESINSGNITLTATASATFPLDITIPFTVSGTAVNPTDHNLADGTITILAGQTTGTTTFKYYRNGALVANQTIIATMGTPDYATVQSPGVNVQTITLVAPGNTAPVANNDSMTVTLNTSNNVFTVLSNDMDADGDFISITSIGAASHGTVVNNSGSLSYTPTAEYYGADSFTYTISDPYGGTSTATVTVTVNPTPFTWTGAAGNNLWSTAGNWYGNAVPTSTSEVRLADNCVVSGGGSANCNITIDANMNAQGVTIVSTYPGTITQGAGITMSVGTTGWIQPTGTFLGSDGAISLTGPLVLSGGSFRSTSGILTMTVTTTINITGTPTFDANSGTITLNQAGAYTSTAITAPAAVNFHNLQILPGGCGTLYLYGTITVQGATTVTLKGSSCGSWTWLDGGGTIDMKGDFTFGGTAGFAVWGPKNGYFKVSGPVAGTQNLSFPMTTWRTIANLEIAAAGTVVITGYPQILGNFTYTSGTLDTSMNAIFMVGGGTISSGALTFGSVYMYPWNMDVAISGTLKTGSLFLNALGGANTGSISNGTIEVSGNATFMNAPGAVTSNFDFTGGAVGTKNISMSTGVWKAKNITFNSPGSTFSFNSTGTITQTVGSTITATAGSLQLGGASYTLTTSNLDLSGNVFTKNGGSLIVNSVNIGTGALLNGTVDP